MEKGRETWLDRLLYLGLATMSIFIYPQAAQRGLPVSLTVAYTARQTREPSG